MRINKQYILKKHNSNIRFLIDIMILKSMNNNIIIFKPKIIMNKIHCLLLINFSICFFIILLSSIIHIHVPEFRIKSLFVFLILLFLIHLFKNHPTNILMMIMITCFLDFNISCTINNILYFYVNGRDIIIFSVFSSSILYLYCFVYAIKTKKNYAYMRDLLHISLLVIFISNLLIIKFNILLFDFIISLLFVLISFAYILFIINQIIIQKTTACVTTATLINIYVYNILINFFYLFTGCMSEI